MPSGWDPSCGKTRFGIGPGANKKLHTEPQLDHESETKVLAARPGLRVLLPLQSRGLPAPTLTDTPNLACWT